MARWAASGAALRPQRARTGCRLDGSRRGGAGRMRTNAALDFDIIGMVFKQHAMWAPGTWHSTAKKHTKKQEGTKMSTSSARVTSRQRPDTGGQSQDGIHGGQSPGEVGAGLNRGLLRV